MENVLITQNLPGATLLRLNRPKKRNALNQELLQALIEQIEKLHSEKGPKILMIAGEGPVFCSGMDLSEEGDKGNLLADIYNLLHFSPLITIAAVHGSVLAGGIGLMTACDLVVAHPETKFGIPELQRGLVPAQVLAFLIRQIPMRNIKEMLFLGEMIDAAKAQAIGLINRADEDPIKKALQLANQVLKGAPAATQMAKQLLQQFDASFPEDLQYGLRLHHQMMETKESKEGIESFLQKRDPKW